MAIIKFMQNNIVVRSLLYVAQGKVVEKKKLIRNHTRILTSSN